MSDDPKKTTSISRGHLQSLFDLEELSEQTDPEIVKGLQEQINMLNGELEHARSEIALRDDILEDVHRRMQFSALAERAVRAELDRTHRMYRSVLHHLDIAITICYDPAGKLWLSRKAIELAGIDNTVGAEMRSPDDWSVMGKCYDRDGKYLEPRKTPMWLAIKNKEPQLGKVLFMHQKWIYMDVYPVVQDGMVQAYSIWFTIDPQMDPPRQAIGDLLT